MSFGKYLYVLIVVLSVAGYPLVASFSSITGLENRALSIAMRSVLVFASLACLFHVRYLSISRLGDLGAMCAIGFWLGYLMRMIYASVLDGEDLQGKGSDLWIWAIGASLVPMLSTAVSAAEQNWPTIHKAVFVSTMFVLAMAGMSILSRGGASFNGRFGLDSLNPISLGHIAASALLISLYQGKEPIFPSQRYFEIGVRSFGIVAGGLLLFLSGSRGPLVAFGVATALLLITRSLKQNIRILGFVSIVAFLFFQKITEVVAEFGATATYRIVNMAAAADAASESRLETFRGAWSQFLESPVLGSSLLEKTSNFYPHNVVLEGYMSTGLVGGTLLLAALIIGVTLSVRAQKFPEIGWIGLLFMQYAVGSMFSGSIYSSSTFWVCLGALCSGYGLARSKQSALKRLSLSHA